jgi:putative membrane protein
MKFILRLLLNALALLVVARFVPGITLDSTFSAIIAALLLGVVNAVVRPVLLLLTLPINLLTLGVFTFVINSLMLELVAAIVKGFTVANFSAALIGSVVLWLLSMLIDQLLRPREA